MEPISKCWGWVSELVWQLETHLCPVQCLHLSFSDIRVAGGKPCLKLKYSVLSSKWPSGSASPGLDGPSSSSTLCNQWSLPPLHPHLSCCDRSRASRHLRRFQLLFSTNCQLQNKVALFGRERVESFLNVFFPFEAGALQRQLNCF